PDRASHRRRGARGHPRDQFHQRGRGDRPYRGEPARRPRRACQPPFARGAGRRRARAHRCRHDRAGPGGAPRPVVLRERKETAPARAHDRPESLVAPENRACALSLAGGTRYNPRDFVSGSFVFLSGKRVMSVDERMDSSRRTLLLATSAAGGVAAVATAVPFVASLTPSERAKAAGAAVEADVSKLAPGEMMTVEWRGKPVWILRRTPEMLASLDKTEDKVSDPASDKPQQPEYAKNKHRSINPEFL